MIPLADVHLAGGEHYFERATKEIVLFGHRHQAVGIPSCDHDFGRGGKKIVFLGRAVPACELAARKYGQWIRNWLRECRPELGAPSRSRLAV